MRDHPEVPLWVCVGDLADHDGRYEPLDGALYWIKGNNENFDAIAARDLPPGLHYLPNAELATIGGLRVAGLGGTLAPTLYDTPAADLPHPPLRQAQGRPELRRGTVRPAQGHAQAGAGTGSARSTDRRRHFVREEVEACKRLARVDLFLSHEAPRPFRVGRMDAGKTPINEVLAAMKPRLHLFGHHHRFSEQVIQGVPSVGLDLVSRSYLLIDPVTMQYEYHQVAVRQDPVS